MPSVKYQLKVGDKVYFEGERLGYTVQACDENFAVCSKPFNPQRTVLYCIIDWRNNKRGPEGLVFGAGAETRGQCGEMLERLQCGETEVSYRRSIQLNITKVVYA